MVCGRKATHRLCFSFSFLCTTCSSNRPVEDAIGLPLFSFLVLCPSPLYHYSYTYMLPSPPSPFLRSIQDLSSIQTPSYGPLPVTPSAFTLPSTSFRYSLPPPSSYQSQSQPSLTRFFFFKKRSRSKNQKPDFIKHSVDFPISSNYVCKPFQITRFDCPSLF